MLQCLKPTTSYSLWFFNHIILNTPVAWPYPSPCNFFWPSVILCDASSGGILWRATLSDAWSGFEDSLNPRWGIYEGEDGHSYNGRSYSRNWSRFDKNFADPCLRHWEASQGISWFSKMFWFVVRWFLFTLDWEIGSEISTQHTNASSDSIWWSIRWLNICF